MPAVETNGTETYYERHGDGPELVLIHGAGLDHRAWTPQVEAFAGEYEVVTYDVRGHGDTGPSERSTYTIDLLAADLHALVAELGLERPAVCGLSLGGMVAQRYAVEYPEDLGAVVLADTDAGESLTVGERLLRTVPATAVLGANRVLGPERAAGMLERLEGVAERFYGEAASGHDEELRAIGDEAVPDPAEYMKVLEAATSGFDPVDHSRIDVPALVVYGEHEPGMAARHAETMADRIPDAECVELPDAGHVSNWDAPEAFNGTLREFLAESHPRPVEG